MIFRAGSLIANMMMGIILLGKRYTNTKYVSVLMITAGIIICTIMSAKAPKPSDGEEQEDMVWLSVGIFLLTFALFLSARMGIYQEVIYGKYGKHPKEALFFLHALPLPGFILLAPDIYNHILVSFNSHPLTLPLPNIQIPCMLV